MDFRVQGLDPAVHHFRETGIVRDLGHRDALFGQQFRRTACRQDLDIVSLQKAGDFKQAGFVGDAEQRALDFFHGCKVPKLVRKVFQLAPRNAPERREPGAVRRKSKKG